MAWLPRYWPRASRSRVGSNLREVRGRDFGPMNGRQPIVNVIATARSTNKPRRTTPGFAQAVSSRVWSSCHLRSKVPERNYSK
jgi:hypothetical protein